MKTIEGLAHERDCNAAEIIRLDGELTKAREEIVSLRMALDLATGPHCPYCGNSIDPEVCHCGGEIRPDRFHAEDHAAVSMGCICGYAEPDWKALAKSRGELLWKQRRSLVDLERLAPLAPLRSVLDNWAWTAIEEEDAGRIDDEDCQRQVIAAFARAEDADRKAKESSRG